jgi:uncharacterized protein (DUF1684 family)
MKKEMTKRAKAGIAFITLLLLALFSCSGDRSKEEEGASYVDEVKKWHENRIKSLKREDGWLSLSGLFWLKEGENSFGTAPSNDIVFPEDKAPEFIGWFVLENEQVSVKIKSDVQIFHNDAPVTEMLLQSDGEGEPTVLTFGSLKWHVIKRDDKFGIRLKDIKNPNRDTFEGIEQYPVSPEWRIKAKFLPYDPPKKIILPTILGTVTEESSPGALEFKINDQIYRLDPVGDIEDEQLFVLFADQTNGIETYGAGRYLLVKKPDEEGTAYIDFNKAYNPPCAFTEYATCPFPPSQNKLPVKITAGEKGYKHALH